MIPVVVHQGPGAWPAARSVGELLDVPATLRSVVSPFLPELRLAIDDLGATDRAAVLARPGSEFVRLALAILQAVRRGDAPRALEEAAPAIRAVFEEPGGPERLADALRYIQLATEHEPPELRRALERVLGPNGADVMTTSGQRLIEQGLEQGLEGSRRLVLSLLTARFGAPGPDVRARIERASFEELDALVPRAATAATLDEALGRDEGES